MKLVISFACGLVFALGSAVAFAGEGCQSACADGYTWSSEQGVCVPKSVTS